MAKEKREKFIDHKEFYTFPGAMRLYLTEKEAVCYGGDQVRMFSNIPDAVSYARGIKYAEIPAGCRALLRPSDLMG